MKQKYDNNFSWLHQHVRRHLGLEDERKTDEIEEINHVNEEHDGINVDSEVIISEYRLLYLKYKEQIKMYKEAIANLSLKQIINNEEEAWVEHRLALDKNKMANVRDTQLSQPVNADEDEDGTFNKDDALKTISNVATYEFEEEVKQLSSQLKEKI